jgi:NAD(P)-dependent dehydrogenase (short-subunit alcohol dehydrogenase family)
MSVMLITGCSSGFGLLAALHCARNGDTVYASMRDTSKASPLETARQSEGLPLHVVELDVTDAASVESAVQNVLDTAGRIDVLVNNAGIGARGPMEETEDDEVKEIFETNFFGALRCMRAVAPVMRAQGSGMVINVSSLAGVVTAPFQGVYSASKRALEAATEAFYYEMHPFGVSFTLIEPGGFETNIENTRRIARRYTEGSPYTDYDRRFEEALTRLPAAGERADPQVVAELIHAVAHQDNPKLRRLVGQDAETIGGTRRRLDDEQFEKAMRTALDYWD